jgi:acetyltransferase
MGLKQSRERVSALLSPRNVAIVGASDRPGSWAVRVWRNLNRYGYPGPIYPINPNRSEIWDRACYADVFSLPEPPDHAVVLIPAKGVPGLLRDLAKAGGRSATIFTSGFGESDDVGAKALAGDLERAIAETGLAVSGPNCFGNFSAPSRFVSFVEDRHLALETGPVALVGQSGGVMMFANQVLEERGIAVSYIVSSGNEAGLASADYIAFFAADPGIRVIVSYLEAIKDMEKFLEAARAAREAGKTVVVLKLGQTAEGREAAMAHTGALAGSAEAFDAVAGSAGVIRVGTLDEAIEAVEYLVHSARLPAGRRLAGMTLSGAYRGLLLEAAAKNGLNFPPLAPETERKLKDILSVGSIVGNPLDGGYGVVSSAENYLACLQAMESDPNVDMLLVQEELPRNPENQRAERYIGLVEDYAANRAQKPIAFVSLLSHSQSDHSRGLRPQFPHVPFLQEPVRALGVIARMVRQGECHALGQSEVLVRADAEVKDKALGDRLRKAARAAGDDGIALNEVRCKEVLRAYGIESPDERFAASRDAAMDAARELGPPLVLKAVSAELLHKSDMGAVMLRLDTPEQVGAAWDTITGNLENHGVGDAVEGMLVSRFVGGGVEVSLGLHRDPESGPVIMVGSGGTLLELVRDVAFSAPPVGTEKVMDMLARTKVMALLQGYRGSGSYDVDAVAAALAALGAIAMELGDTVRSIDINPFMVLPAGEGGMALDALIVLQSNLPRG